MKRYNFKAIMYCNPIGPRLECVHCEDGEYVKYEDAQKLAKAYRYQRAFWKLYLQAEKELGHSLQEMRNSSRCGCKASLYFHKANKIYKEAMEE